MEVRALVVSFAGIAAVLFAASWLSSRLRLPTPTAQFLLGAVAANSVVALGYDTGLRYQNFHDLVFYVFLPVLVFTAAFAIDAGKLKRQWVQVSSLAVAGLLLTTVFTAVCLYYAINHPSGFPWLAALLTGALLAATDPAAATSQPWLHESRPRLALLLEGESLFNDATAVVLFSVILSLALQAGDTTAAAISQSAALTFIWEISGGLLIGLAAGAAGYYLSRSAALSHRLWLGLALAFAVYHLSLSIHASGVVACLACGLWMGQDADQEPAAKQQWVLLGDTTNGILFVLMGATITVSMFTERWLAMLLAIAAVVVARFVSVHSVLGALAGFGRYSVSLPVNLQERNLVGLLGMRGAITIALVLVLPVELPYWWTVQSIAYGVVLFDLLVTAPLMPVLLKR
ncbi:MAG: cation:proton antiporter [Pseudomonadota bacterium]